MPRTEVSVDVNGEPVRAAVETRTLLVHFLRREAGASSVKVGCDTTSCGACAVLLDGRAVKSCTLFAVQAEGRSVRTVEGLSEPGAPLHPLQEALRQEHGLQCGYCTSGMLMAACRLVEAGSTPSEDEIREAISGNICRCTGYAAIVAAVRRACAESRSASAEPVDQAI
jgi:carbon-monoxide dehydrogenase small subunit